MTNDEIEDALWRINSELVMRAVKELKPQALPLWQEAKEPYLIFAKIWRRANESHSFVIRHLSFVIVLIRRSSFF